MKNEQLNLYGGDRERFRAVGKTPEELEEKTKETILINKIVEFVDEKKSDIWKIISEEGKLSGLHIYSLAKEFTGDVQDDNFIFIKKILAKTLLDKKYKLSPAVVRAEVEGKDGALLERKLKQDAERAGDIKSVAEEKRESRKKREKLPGPQKGLPTGDLE